MPDRFAMDPDADSLSSDGLEQDDEQGWEDVEDDTEHVHIISLFDDRTFRNAKDMLLDCKTRYDFDVWQVRQDLGQCFHASFPLSQLSILRA